MCETILQNRMALDFLTAGQGGTCVIIKLECCIYILDYDKSITGLFTDINNQIGTFKSPT